jgi:hypothetical protein
VVAAPAGGGSSPAGVGSWATRRAWTRGRGIEEIGIEEVGIEEPESRDMIELSLPGAIANRWPPGPNGRWPGRA